MDKLQSQRASECIAILKQIRDDLKIPDTNPSIRLLKKRMEKYIRDGKNQQDRIPLVNSDRFILYRLPRRADEIVEVTMRVGRVNYQQLPSDLAAELEGQRNSVQQSDPAHLSPQESTD